MVFEGRSGIRDAYQDEGVARRYIDERFREPLGALLHARQASALKRLLAARQPCRMLEIAPGPGRLTTEIAGMAGIRGTVVDASAQMLAQARQRVMPLSGGRWTFVHGDAFQLPFEHRFDAVVVFRFIRHFNDEDRRRLYREFARVLKPGGILVFDAINERVSAALRRTEDASEYPVFDALLSPERLRAELSEAGLALTELSDVQHRFLTLRAIQVYVAPRSRVLARAAMEVVDRLGGGPPLEWIVTCTRA